MTIGGWIVFSLLAVMFVITGIFIAIECDSKTVAVIVIIMALLLTIGLYAGFHWYFTSTASGQRALTDQKSELNNGLDRHVTVYTANGDVLAEYEGRIDIEANDGGYIKFDFDGHRYIYYNCFVESIAEIGG